MSRRAAELAEVALGYIAVEKAEEPTALDAETSGLDSNAPVSANSAALRAINISKLQMIEYFSKYIIIKE